MLPIENNNNGDDNNPNNKNNASNNDVNHLLVSPLETETAEAINCYLRRLLLARIVIYAVLL